MTIKQIDTHDSEGLFVVMYEARNQAPMIMETEAVHSTYEAARKRAGRSFMLRTCILRTCICRVIPIEGNELLTLDMMRLQEGELPF